MNDLYNQPDVITILSRLEKLSPAHQKQWGKMDPAQMLAHCNVSMETALGKNFIKRIFIGRLIGSLLKNSVLGEKPFDKNSPTDKTYILSDKTGLDFDEERKKLIKSIRQFSDGGPSACTKHPHPFFGQFTPDQWAIFQWKHLDHHLRQFGL